MTKANISIVDYGSGNLVSIRQVLYNLGYRSKVTNQMETLRSADIVILPGVGAFPPAMAQLITSGLDQSIIEHALSGKLLIGICLGMQLMATISHENAETAGLGIIPGVVSRIPGNICHVGWNTVKTTQSIAPFNAIDGETFFFNHSYAYVDHANSQVMTTHYNHSTITAAIRIDNVIGFQFHPEKSQSAGRALLKSCIEDYCHG